MIPRSCWPIALFSRTHYGCWQHPASLRDSYFLLCLCPWTFIDKLVTCPDVLGKRCPLPCPWDFLRVVLIMGVLFCLDWRDISEYLLHDPSDPQQTETEVWSWLRWPQSKLPDLTWETQMVEATESRRHFTTQEPPQNVISISWQPVKLTLRYYCYG